MKRASKQGGMSAAAFMAGYSNPIARSVQPTTVLVPQCWAAPVCESCGGVAVARRTVRGIEFEHACVGGRAS